MADQIPVLPIVYRLSIYPPQRRDGAADFMSTTPFQPLSVGDRVMATTWSETDPLPNGRETFVVAAVSEVIRGLKREGDRIFDITIVHTDPLPPSPL